jgi:hypothetical protein
VSLTLRDTSPNPFSSLTRVTLRSYHFFHSQATREAVAAAATTTTEGTEAETDTSRRGVARRGQAVGILARQATCTTIPTVEART